MESILNEKETGAWRALMRAHHQIAKQLDALLIREEGISLTGFEVLRWLRKDGPLRMSVIADLVLLSRSGVTRLIDQLEAKGLIERRACPSDRRGWEAVITEEGVATVERASKSHFQAVRDLFTGRMTEAELTILETALAKAFGDSPDCA